MNPWEPNLAEQVLEFWFGVPARTEAELAAKIERWFLNGAALDREIQMRFGSAVEAALAGELDGGAHTPRGRLALVLLLDQCTRHVFRGSSRAYAGDERAQRLALGAFAAGSDAPLELVERIFLSLPLMHAEDVAPLERAVALARRFAAEAPPEFASLCAAHVEQAEKYLTVVRRFGRFPHRNQVLGRACTPEEEVFLIDWADKARPRAAGPRAA